MALVAKPKPKKKNKNPLSPEEKKILARKRAFENQFRSIFTNAGFRRLPGVDGVHFEFEGLKSELDDIFVYENVLIFAEYTTSNPSNISAHAKGKAGIHNKIASNPFGFVTHLRSISARLDKALEKFSYTKNQTLSSVIYGSDPSLENHHKALFDETVCISRAERMYFRKLALTLRKSSRYELFDFLGIDATRVGQAGTVPTGSQVDRYHGSLLPDEHSNFPPGYRIVSFYVDPEALLKRAYVLRRDGWKDSQNLYQRMIIPGKIKGIRRYLREQHRVFANNIVITLPDNTEFRDDDGTIIDSGAIGTTTPAWVEIADVPNTIGIVDGQHRVFSYYEDLKPDALIDQYRRQQNLLATGIVYPQNIPQTSKEQFEAGLFLEINTNQAGARSDLKQAIWLILDPFRPVSVARNVVNRLAAIAPLNGILEQSAYDIGRLRTTTIVTYGIQPLVKRSGKDSLFSIWNDPDKSEIIDGKQSAEILERYLEFCTTHIADFLSIARTKLKGEKWAIPSKTGPGVLSVATLNGLIILMRRLIEGGYITHDKITVDLTPLDGMNLKEVRSSQYAALASLAYKKITGG